MATAKVNETIAKTVVLELSDQEAATLIAILSKVGGNPTESARGNAESVYDALQRIGYSYAIGEGQKMYKTMSSDSQIYFNKFEETK